MNPLFRGRGLTAAGRLQFALSFEKPRRKDRQELGFS
jgi:hypothetical protein